MMSKYSAHEELLCGGGAHGGSHGAYRVQTGEQTGVHTGGESLLGNFSGGCRSFAGCRACRLSISTAPPGRLLG